MKLTFSTFALVLIFSLPSISKAELRKKCIHRGCRDKIEKPVQELRVHADELDLDIRINSNKAKRKKRQMTRKLKRAGFR